MTTYVFPVKDMSQIRDKSGQMMKAAFILHCLKFLEKQGVIKPGNCTANYDDNKNAALVFVQDGIYRDVYVDLDDNSWPQFIPTEEEEVVVERRVLPQYSFLIGADNQLNLAHIVKENGEPEAMIVTSGENALLLLRLDFCEKFGWADEVKVNGEVITDSWGVPGVTFKQDTPNSGKWLVGNETVIKGYRMSMFKTDEVDQIKEELAAARAYRCVIKVGVEVV